MCIRTRLMPLWVACPLLLLGCQEADRYEAQKPIIEESTAEEFEEGWEETKKSVNEAAETVTDAVTPDDPIVDVDSPLGGVRVDKDPATGETKVNIDAGQEG